MAEKDKVFKGKIKNVGLFDFKDFYEFLYNAFMDEGFIVFESKYEEINNYKTTYHCIQYQAHMYVWSTT